MGSISSSAAYAACSLLGRSDENVRGIEILEVLGNDRHREVCARYGEVKVEVTGTSWEILLVTACPRRHATLSIVEST